MVSRRRGLVWILAGIAVAVDGVFFLPWYIPLTQPVVGDSYSLGFCNKAAVLALCFALLLVFIGLLRNGEKTTAFSWFAASPVILSPSGRAWREYLIIGIASLICGAATMALNAYLVNPYWGESACFLNAGDLARLGFKPYIDFQFSYGPAFVYLPVFLDRLSGNTLGNENAYALSLALCYAAGFVFLYIFQRFLNFRDRDRPWILALTVLTWFFLVMGLQYTPVRFAIVPCALGLGSLSLASSAASIVSHLRSSAIIALCGLACFSISPEMGIASTIGFTASAAVHFRVRRIPAVSATLLGICTAAALIWKFSLASLDGVFGFGGGGFNFPIYPNYANVALVLVTLTVLPKIAAAIWQRPGDPNAPLAAALAAASVTLLPASLGRCDPGHVFFNEMPLFILMFAVAAQYKRSYLISWGVLFAAMLIFMDQLSYWGHYAIYWRKAIAEHNYYQAHPDRVKQWADEWQLEGQGSNHAALLDWRKIAPFPEIGGNTIQPDDRLAAPLGAEVGLDRYLKLRPNYRPEYYPILFPQLFTAKDVSRAVAETKTNYDVMVIPRTTLIQIRTPRDRPGDALWLQEFLSGLMVYPVGPYVFRNPSYSPEYEVAKQLHLVDAPAIEPDRDYLVVRVPR